MKKEEVKKRIEKLTNQIEDLRYRYHVLNDPKVTDDIYESLQRELKKLEEEFPEFKNEFSITNRVAGKPLDKFVKVKHDIRMLSLNDVFSEQELEDWEKRIKKILGDRANNINYFAEIKLDGLAVSLIYENGNFVRGATRGDGFVGEDITQNLKTIQSIPLKLRAPFLEFIEVRGEAIMSKKVFRDLNIEYQKAGKSLLANTRNAAAGSLRQLDSNLTAERKLEFYAYDVVQIRIQNIEHRIQTHSDRHGLLRNLGFKVESNEQKCKSLVDVKNFVSRIGKLREGFNYGTDGIVICVDSLESQNVLGIVGKAPRYAVAFKYPAEKATTIIKEIKVNVGRTGVLTPLAVFEPTLVAGSVISKATLHNMDQINRLDVRVGDTVVIQKAGDVIPEVVEVLFKMRSGKEKKFKMLEQCPVCDFLVEKRIAESKKEGTSVAYYCTNPKCPAKNRRFMQHFVSVFEIYEIGPKILDRFQEEGLISDAGDIFALTKEDIEVLERFGEKSAENIIQSIKEHSMVTLPRFIFALGILHVGEQTAEDLAKAFGSLEKIKQASLEEITNIENIGPVVSESVYKYFQDKDNLKFIEKLFRNGVNIQYAEYSTQNTGLAGKTFVITGTLQSIGRDEAKKKIKELGGKVSSSVSKNTSYLVAGQTPGSKYDNAIKLGVKILNEKDFLNLIKQ